MPELRYQFPEREKLTIASLLVGWPHQLTDRLIQWRMTLVGKKGASLKVLNQRFERDAGLVKLPTRGRNSSCLVAVANPIDGVDRVLGHAWSAGNLHYPDLWKDTLELFREREHYFDDLLQSAKWANDKTASRPRTFHRTPEAGFRFTP